MDLIAPYVPINALFPSATVRDFAVSSTPGWSSFNPCIAFSPTEGYRMIVRSSNYVMSDDELNYLMNDPDQVIRTINFLCELDSELNIVSMAPIDDSRVRGEIRYPWVRGMEDARLYWNGHEWHTYGTLREHRQDGNCEIAEDTLHGTTAVYRALWNNPEPWLPQKNWAILGEGPKWVYRCCPPTVLDSTAITCDTNRRVVEGVSEFRGGSQAIPFDDGFVSIIHEVTWSPKPRQYWHRFVKYDREGFITHATPGFYFLAEGIEFAAGIVEHRGDLVVSVGFKEHRTLLARVAISELTPHWISVLE